MRMKVDANVPIKVTNRRRRVERLRKGRELQQNRVFAKGRYRTHLYSTHVLTDVRPDDGPTLRIGSVNVRLGHANRKLFEHTAKKLEIGQLHRIYPNIVAQLDHHELRLLPRCCRRRARREHIPVPLGGQNVGGGFGGGMRGVDAG
jgi:hypothetical protein